MSISSVGYDSQSFAPWKFLRQTVSDTFLITTTREKLTMLFTLGQCCTSFLLLQYMGRCVNVMIQGRNVRFWGELASCNGKKEIVNNDVSRDETVYCGNVGNIETQIAVTRNLGFPAWKIGGTYVFGKRRVSKVWIGRCSTNRNSDCRKQKFSIYRIVRYEW